MRGTRVLMLTPDEGQLDRRIVQEAGSLARRGATVDLYPAADPRLEYEAPLPPGVRVLPSAVPAATRPPYRRALRWAKLRVARRLPSAGRLIEALRYRTADPAEAIAASSLAHLAAVPAYDVVFAHDVPVMPLAARLAERWACALVCDLHEAFPEQAEHFTTQTARDYWRGVESAGLAAADGVLCVNRAVADYVASTHAPSAEVGVVHNAVPYVDRDELRGATLRDYFALPDGARVAVYAGTLREHAGLEALVAGFAAARLDGWVLALIGSGPMEDELRRLAHRHGAAESVFLGRRAPQSQLVPVIASADFGLIPYQAHGFNQEIATPNKLFEYIQARIPIAASRLPMIQDLLATHGNGGGVDFSTPESTAIGLRQFVSTRLPAIDDGALEAAASRFCWENEEAELFRVVDSAMRRTVR